MIGGVQVQRAFGSKHIPIEQFIVRKATQYAPAEGQLPEEGGVVDLMLQMGVLELVRLFLFVSYLYLLNLFVCLTLLLILF